VTVVFLHALPLDERIWEPQIAAVSGEATFAPRLYDLGSSMDEWAEAVLAQVEGPFTVVGASMGGYAALAVARRARERLRGLVLSGSRADADPEERREARENALRLVAEEGAPALWEDMQRTAFSTTPADVRARLTPIAESQSPEGLANAIRAIRDRQDSRDVLRSLPFPFLLVAGDDDPLVPVEVAREQAALAPDGRVEIFEDVGHLPGYQAPDRFNSVLRSFLEDVA
jgi:pimeloyl-ACP methyl ester carboxylesterase